MPLIEKVPPHNIDGVGKDESWYTVSEAIEELFPNVNFTADDKIHLEQTVASSWETLKKQLPTKVIWLHRTGYIVPPLVVYPSSFLPEIKNEVTEFRRVKSN